VKVSRLDPPDEAAARLGDVKYRVRTVADITKAFAERVRKDLE
jgi:hypothetical protein